MRRSFLGMFFVAVRNPDNFPHRKRRSLNIRLAAGRGVPKVNERKFIPAKPFLNEEGARFAWRATDLLCLAPEALRLLWLKAAAQNAAS